MIGSSRLIWAASPAHADSFFCEPFDDSLAGPFLFFRAFRERVLYCWSRLNACLMCSGVGWTYREVTRMSLWPAIFWIEKTSAPDCASRVSAVCRKIIS